MKIIHIIYSFYTGGAEAMLVDILNEQSKTEDVELIIVNNLYNPDLVKKVQSQIKIHYINRVEGSFNIMDILRLNLLLYRYRPDIIHLHNHRLIWLIKYKAKIYLTIHDVNVPAKGYNKVDKVFSISNAVKLNILMRGGPDSTLVYNGIDFGKFETKTNYKLQNKFKIVQVSSLIHLKKGQHTLLEALNYLVHQKNISNISVDFIGEGTSLDYLKDMTKKLNLEKHVNYLGLKDRDFIYKTLYMYDLLVQPSFYEGFGLTVIEGIAAGLPVIVSNIDGPSEIVQGLPAGLTFETGNVDSLVKALLLIMQLYEENRIKQLVDESYDKAFTKFSVQTTAQNYINNY